MKKGFAMLVVAGLGSLALTGNASADAERGKQVFRKCQACHSLEPGDNKVGPSLHGIMGQPAGHVEGYTYSSALEKSELVWDDETMGNWLRSPRKLVKGTKMAFPGLRKDGEIEDVIEYIRASSE
ncbi:c-type cytochrome [Chelativorans salis]|uniref:Cytochrome c family protein n=1 Tax=Chelativorans salis TaxID=2978478 RepID=A0ABT2LIF5_9HYPH|nr:cytochrome c family protein [Chelativorans sp. EGI FJ00035]MCT7374295.1 cytochrome c family protein [Chelativorans sp. EGI FJ00035]